ncbi:MAG: amidophosphoribosyltransferase, partial [Acidimicrobiales bacterium]
MRLPAGQTVTVDADAGKPREACGVFGVYAPGQPVSHFTYLGLYALQHRGQEAAGMAVSDGESITVVKEQGLVSNAFDDRTLAALTGHLAIGHTRYSTTGSSTWRNAQPVYRSVGDTEFVLGHNGNLTNTEQLAAAAGMLAGTVTSDSDLVAELLATELARLGPHSDDRQLERALEGVLPTLQGAFTFVLADEGRVIGVRDPHGFRPLCLGRLERGWVLASETPALDIVGAHFVRELEPG